MVFSSTLFIFLFLPLVLLCYFLLKESYRNVFLLLASLAFYACGGIKFTLVMIASILINYFMGLFIEYGKKNLDKIGNRIILVITVLLNLSLLFYFKYTDFFIESVNGIFKTNIALRNITLPIGISFFTFQGMSYTLDLYMNKVKVQRNPINIALYISLFPQLIAGPIVRYKDINEQIDCRVCTIDGFTYGVKRFIIGLAKKVIIANNVGLVVDEIFKNQPNENSIAIAWVGAICYTIQIYFDFGGYSDMAIGLGKMFGFNFLENFNYPYISKSITEFWRRWHISLSSWFRDYIYIPLGGNRTGNVYVNLLIVFLITGLWHGAAWNFVLWGLWHGAFILIERVVKIKNIELNIPSVIRWMVTMLIIILGWVLFRAENLSYAVKYIGVMFGIVNTSNVGFTVSWYLSTKVITVLVLAVIASIPLKEVFTKVNEVLEGTYLKIILSNVYLLLVFAISIILVETSTYNPFIYFRF